MVTDGKWEEMVGNGFEFCGMVGIRVEWWGIMENGGEWCGMRLNGVDWCGIMGNGGQWCEIVKKKWCVMEGNSG